MHARWLALAAILIGLVGCSGNNKTTSSTGGSSGSSGTTSSACTVANASSCTCTSDSDCPPGGLYICDTQQTKLCVFQCQQASDCVDQANAPATVYNTCKSATLGCVCEVDPNTQAATCTPQACGTDQDCGTGVCANGQCVSTPPTNTVDSCKVFPQYQVMHVGSAFTFSAQAYSGGQVVRVPDSAFTWSAADASVTAGTGATASTFTGAAASTGAVAGVKATVNGVTCTAQVQVYGAPAAGSLQVTVVDQLSGTPVSGATVKLEGQANTTTTSASGVATFSGVTAGANTVSVFMAGYGYVTIANTQSTDLLVPLLRNPVDVEGGVKGSTVKNVFDGTSDAHLAIVGMSIAGGVADISFDLLLGPSQPTTVTIGSSSYHVNLPSGVILGLAGNQFKANYAALGRAGYCDSDAAGTAAGTCGNRSIWGLSGDVPIDDLPIDQLQSLSLQNLNLGPILTKLLPVFRTFHSFVVRDQQFNLGATDSSGNVQDQYLVDKQDTLDSGLTGTPPPAVKLSLKETVKVPILPKLGGNYVTGIVALGSSDVPGRGLVPLGLSAALQDSANDGHVADTQANATNPPKDQLTLYMAPNHSGTEGSQYKIGLLAASLTDISNGLSASALILSPGACDSSKKGVCYGGTLDASAQTFPGFPEGATFDYVHKVLTAGSGWSSLGLTLFKVTFEDNYQHRWVIVTNGTGFTLPTLPAGFTDDRTRADDGVSGANAPRSGMTVQAFDFGSTSTFEGMVTFNGANLDHYDSLMQRFAIVDYAPPSISITTPAANDSAFNANSSVAVTISNDAANGNNWYMCWTQDANPVTSTANGCKAGAAVDSTGKATDTVPTGISGSGYLHALLVDSTGAPLAPPVDTSVQETVH